MTFTGQPISPLSPLSSPPFFSSLFTLGAQTSVMENCQVLLNRNKMFSVFLIRRLNLIWSVRQKRYAGHGIQTETSNIFLRIEL